MHVSFFSQGKQLLFEGLHLFQRRLNQAFTPQQQVIVAAALAALSSLAAIYLLFRCIQRERTVKKEINDRESLLVPSKNRELQSDIPLKQNFHEIVQSPKQYFSFERQTQEEQFKEGILSGLGSIIFPSGEKWEGEFERGLLHGLGRIHFSDGRVLEGQFKKGRLVRDVLLTSPQGEVWDCEVNPVEKETLPSAPQSPQGKFTPVKSPLVKAEDLQSVLAVTPLKKEEKQQDKPQEASLEKAQAFPLEVNLMEDSFKNIQALKEDDQAVKEEPLNDTPFVEEMCGEKLAEDGEKKQGEWEELKELSHSPVKTLETIPTTVQAQEIHPLIAQSPLPMPQQEEEDSIKSLSPLKPSQKETMPLGKGTILQGELKDGLLDCRFGKIRFDNGTVYEGEFKKGKLNGLGKMTIPDQEMSIGCFKEGLLEGAGKIEYEDGRVLMGTFRHGILVEGSGTTISPSRRRYLVDSEMKKNVEKDSKSSRVKKSLLNLFLSSKNSPILEEKKL